MQAAKSFSDKIEETLISVILGIMALITFANVIARFVFNSNILWALELTVFLFAWLVLLGASYAVKTRSHLGVDAILNIVSPPARRILGLIAVAACLLFSLLMLKGSYDYWAVFADLPPTSGRWIPTGFADKFRSQSFYEVQDVPMIGVFRFLEDLINAGEEYEKMPKVVFYIVLPVSMALLVFRFTQAAVAIWTGKLTLLVASHEVEEEDIAEARAKAAGDD